MSDEELSPFELLQRDLQTLIRARRTAVEILDRSRDPEVRAAAARLADTIDG